MRALRDGDHAGTDAEEAGKGAPGTRTRTAQLAVQRKATSAPPASAQRTEGAGDHGAPADDPFGLHLLGHDAEDEQEADDGEEAGSVQAPLVAGKPPVQRKEAPGAATRTARAKPLTIAQAIQRYAPLVFLAPGEEYGPSDASQFIEHSRLRWSHDSRRRDHQLADTGQIDEDRLGSGGYSHQVEGVIGGHHGDPIHSDQDARPQDGKGDGGDEGFFLDLDNSARKSLGQNKNAPVYHEAVAGRYITYWFFYSYNPGPTSTPFDNHEGDWERIVVKLDKRNRATRVAYYQHNGAEERAWRDVQKQGTHPIVYSGKGSHASYFAPGKYGTEFPGVKDTAGKGRQWRTWNNLQSAKAQGWYGYGGAWGEVGEMSHTTGPQGPSKHKPGAPKGW